MTYPEPDTGRSARNNLASHDIWEAVKTLETNDALALLGQYAGYIIKLTAEKQRLDAISVHARAVELGRNFG